MYAIALKQEQYKTYILSDQMTQSRLEVVPERGGMITRWAVQGTEILYLDGDRFAKPELSVRGGIPILFPICGNLPDDTYLHQGQSYTLKQHGFARNLPWQVGDRMTQDGVGITLNLESNEQTRSHYPFDFLLSLTYRLRGSMLTLHHRVENRSEEPMPFSVGLHPYFWVADKSQLQFDIPSHQFHDQRTGNMGTFPGRFDFEQDEIDVLFRNPSRPQTCLTDPTRGVKVQIEFEPPYGELVFWTVKGKDYCCLEPWSAPRNAMNTGDRLTILPPGESLETSVRFIATLL